MPQAARIIAIRHGETAWNVLGRIQGHTDIGLNDQGRAQAQQVAQALAGETLDAVYSSDLLRAWETAQAIAAAAQVPLHAESGLRERCFGSFEGSSFAEIAVQQPEAAALWRKRDPAFAPPGGGESLLQLQARIQEAVQRVAAAHVGGHIVLVAHGGVLDMLYRLATRQHLQAPRTWALPNAAVNRLLWTPDSGLMLVGWGDVQHLGGAAREELFS